MVTFERLGVVMCDDVLDANVRTGDIGSIRGIQMSDSE